MNFCKTAFESENTEINGMCHLQVNEGYKQHIALIFNSSLET